MYQWPKNLVVFAALVFAEQLGDPGQIAQSIAAFVVLCAASSAMYLFNDVWDREKDRAHPQKRGRPIASGELSVSTAVVIALLLALGSLAGAYAVRWQLLAPVAGYLILSLAYTLALKNVMLVDVLTVAIGFVIRAMAGAVALDVTFSNWLMVCTLFLALFLSLGKRRREMTLLDSQATNHREVLRHYSVDFLDRLTLIVAASTLLSYAIYTCSPEVVERLKTDKLYLTLPFVVFGLFRYLHLVHHKAGGGDPSKTLLEDWPLWLTVGLWGLTCAGIIYGRALM